MDSAKNMGKNENIEQGEDMRQQEQQGGKKNTKDDK
jgi:hypothetical protein